MSKKKKQSPDRVEAAAKLPASPMSTSSKSQPSTPVNNDDPSTWTKSKKKRMKQKRKREEEAAKSHSFYKKILTTWRRFTNRHLHVLVLLSNLELDYAKLLQEASNSTSNMLRKTLRAFKYPDSYTVKLERSGKNVYTLVLQLSRQLDRYDEMKLKDIFAKYNCEGFAKWLGGMTGWYYSPGVNEWGQFIIARLNDLQSVVKTYAPPELLYCFPDESKTLVWCKRQDLWRCVIDVRFFVERAKKKLPGTSSARRLSLKLLQNSDDGPDSLVHWAHHDPQHNYPLTVVTAESMGRLIELLVELLLQVLPRDADEKLNGILATFENKNTHQHQVSSSSISVDLG